MIYEGCLWVEVNGQMVDVVVGMGMLVEDGRLFFLLELLFKVLRVFGLRWVVLLWYNNLFFQWNLILQVVMYFVEICEIVVCNKFIDEVCGFMVIEY